MLVPLWDMSGSSEAFSVVLRIKYFSVSIREGMQDLEKEATINSFG